VKSIGLYCFSGTGNTYIVAKAMEEAFIKRGCEVSLNSMEMPVDLNKDMVGLVFPVAIQSTFPNVWEFVNKMPQSEGQRVFVVDTMEAFSGGVIGPMKKMLIKKGYKCVGAKELKMATSMQTSEKKVAEGLSKNEKAIVDISDFVEALLSGETTWRRVPLLSDWMRSISRNRKIWTDMSKKIEVRHDVCVGCGLCVRNCPVKAIDFPDKRIMLNHDKCICCMRCVNYCPKNAFTLGGKEVYQKKVEGFMQSVNK